jgi:hypothetical protein
MGPLPDLSQRLISNYSDETEKNLNRSDGHAG